MTLHHTTPTPPRWFWYGNLHRTRPFSFLLGINLNPVPTVPSINSLPPSDIKDLWSAHHGRGLIHTRWLEWPEIVLVFSISSVCFFITSHIPYIREYGKSGQHKEFHQNTLSVFGSVPNNPWSYNGKTFFQHWPGLCSFSWGLIIKHGWFYVCAGHKPRISPDKIN